MEVFFSAWSENPKLLKLLCFKPGVGQNTALPRLLTAVLSFLVYITCRYHVLFNDTDIDINKHSRCIHGMDVELWQYCFTCIHPFKLKVTLQAHCTHTHTHKKKHIDLSHILFNYNGQFIRFLSTQFVHLTFMSFAVLWKYAFRDILVDWEVKVTPVTVSLSYQPSEAEGGGHGYSNSIVLTDGDSHPLP